MCFLFFRGAGAPLDLNLSLRRQRQMGIRGSNASGYLLCARNTRVAGVDCLAAGARFRMDVPQDRLIWEGGAEGAPPPLPCWSVLQQST